MMLRARPNKPTFSFPSKSGDSRFQELVVYLAQKCASDETFGATKLNKLLYFSDFLSYQRYGKSITGAAYMKLEFGPVPEQIFKTRKALIRDKAIQEVEMVYGGYRQRRIVAKRQADLSKFSPEDIALVDQVIDWLRNQNASSVSQLSYNIAWKIAGFKGQIPYESVFLSDTMPTDADVAWAKALNTKHGWNA